MTAYQVMPGLTAEEYAALRDDIAANGVRVPVDVDENGQVLDGHHRALIAAELGIDCPRRILDGLTEAEKIAHAYAVNIQRRSLSQEQKRALVAASLSREPHLSDRQHAARTGVDHKTVGGVRTVLQSTGEIPQSDIRVSADGRTRPAHVTTTSRTTESTKTEYDIDTGTGEILDGPTLAGRAAADQAMNAISDFISSDVSYRQAVLVKDLSNAIGKWRPPIDMDATEAASLPVRDADLLLMKNNIADLNAWVTAFNAARSSGLRLISGGK